MIRLTKLSRLPDRYPLACQWEITCRCNLRCVMCYTDCRNRPEFVRDELSTDEILRLMDEMAEAGTLEICLTGGEPLARPDFFILYEHAVRQGFLVTLFTNGTLIHEAEADRLAGLRPHRIEISLHGITAQTFERITSGPGSYRRCMDAIDLLLDRRLPLVLKSTALTLNRHEILAIKRDVVALGRVPFKLSEDLRPDLNGSHEPFRYALSEQEITALNQDDADLREETCRKNTAAPGPCESGMHRFHIDAYGRLQLCSGNRAESYDLRRGSFLEGFFTALPAFACEWKAAKPIDGLRSAIHHA
jgi:MoaA/NifB/PqqE/SkfB family radical SAM enzyme